MEKKHTDNPRLEVSMTTVTSPTELFGFSVEKCSEDVRAEECVGECLGPGCKA